MRSVGGDYQRYLSRLGTLSSSLSVNEATVSQIDAALYGGGAGQSYSGLATDCVKYRAALAGAAAGALADF